MSLVHRAKVARTGDVQRQRVMEDFCSALARVHRVGRHTTVVDQDVQPACSES